MATKDTDTTVHQPTPAPSRKVAAGGLAGALTIILVWAVAQFGLEVPGEVASAITVIVSFFTSYFTSERVQGVEG